MPDYPAQWDRDGYLVMRRLLDPATLVGLREACEHAFAQWKATSSADNQPGPWWYSPNAWIMLHLNHARYYGDRPEFLGRVLNAIATPAAIAAITDIMGEPPLFLQANYYIDPPTEPFAGGGSWHRDCQFFAHGDEETEKRFFFEEASPPRELHMHIPLVPTQATGVVPGSHNRWDSPEELRARRHYSTGPMPGGIRLPMEPGDVGFFHVNAIHRGYYELGVPRRTIAITFGCRRLYRPFDPAWWKMTKGYVASYQPWTLKPGYFAHAQPQTVRLFQRFIDTYRDQWTAQNLAPEVIGPQRVEYFTKF